MKCCCGHDKAVHLGGIDLDQAGLDALRVQRPSGDGGMCRAAVGPPMCTNDKAALRCDCFNFCDCYTVTSDDDGPIRAGDLL
jgi:hypothetical protein